MDWFPILGGFIGTLCALAITKTLERHLSRAADEAEAAQDLVIVVAGILAALRPCIDRLAYRATLTSKEDVCKIPSGINIGVLPVSLDKLLPVFKEAELHRLLIRFYSRFDFFKMQSDVMRTAYFWLLDDEKNWDRPAVAERVESIMHARQEMMQYATEMLRYGYRLLECLIPKTKSAHAWAARGSYISFLASLKQEFGLDVQEAAIGRAYYAARFDNPSDTRAYDSTKKYARFLYRIESSLLANTWLSLAVSGLSNASCKLLVIPNEEFALPSGAKIEDVQLFHDDLVGRQHRVQRAVTDTDCAALVNLEPPAELLAELRAPTKRA